MDSVALLAIFIGFVLLSVGSYWVIYHPLAGLLVAATVAEIYCLLSSSSGLEALRLVLSMCLCLLLGYLGRGRSLNPRS